MFEKVIESLENKEIRGATLDMYIYPNGEFTIVPSGHSKNREWIGSRNLDYKIKGNLKSMDINSIIDKIEEGLYISVNYDERGILAKKENVEEKFLENARKEDFKNYYKVSFVLLSQAKKLRVNSLTCVDKKNDEWVAKRENSVEFELSQRKNLEKYIEENFSRNIR